MSKFTRTPEAVARAVMLATAAKIKILRKETRAGPIECKKALDIEKGDVQQAANWLRVNGKATPLRVWT